MIESNELSNKILIEIKKSKKYQDISDEIIKDEIIKYLNKNPNLIKKNKLKKNNLSQIKANLHRIYASYQTSNKNKRTKLINQLKDNKENPQIINDLLKTHRSTYERLIFYTSLYKDIFKITNKPETINDLGCGLNPISIPLMNLKKIKYHAYDIEKSEIIILNDFFNILKIQAKADILDTKDLEKIKNIPNSDIIFMFKLIDLIDTK
ncbi:hypothetical protein GOV12_04670, partial [Candidatus Pacearchaeota archaeon]|nr:hypothetical protein [Candidatus Pacearchaeota archaeon]